MVQKYMGIGNIKELESSSVWELCGAWNTSDVLALCYRWFHPTPLLGDLVAL